MLLTNAGEADFGRLIEIWEAAVRATHTFLNESDIKYYRLKVREVYLHQVDLTIAKTYKDSEIMGFMGVVPPKEESPARVEMLFVDPAFHGRGVGRALIKLAADNYGPLELQVNEQNPGARIFYKKMGFRTLGRQKVDGQGRPFPLFNLRLDPAADI